LKGCSEILSPLAAFDGNKSVELLHRTTTAEEESEGGNSYVKGFARREFLHIILDLIAILMGHRPGEFAYLANHELERYIIAYATALFEPGESRRNVEDVLTKSQRNNSNVDSRLWELIWSTVLIVDLEIRERAVGGTTHLSSHPGNSTQFELFQPLGRPSSWR
jgi:hypothetical protein